MRVLHVSNTAQPSTLSVDVSLISPSVGIGLTKRIGSWLQRVNAELDKKEQEAKLWL